MQEQESKVYFKVIWYRIQKSIKNEEKIGWRKGWGETT